MKKVVKNKPKPLDTGNQIDDTPYDVEAMQFFLLEKSQITNQYIDKFANDMLNYFCDHENTKYINEYHLRRGVTKSAYYRWLERSPRLKLVHDFCLEILGLRREKAMEKANAHILRLRQYQYDQEFGAAEERQVEMRKKEDADSKGNVTVIMPNNERVIPEEQRPKGKDEGKS